MMKDKILLLIAIIMMSISITVSAQHAPDHGISDSSSRDTLVQDVSKHVTDTVYCIFPIFSFDDSITLPVKCFELEKYEDVLNSLPGVSISDDGNIYVKGDSRIKASQIIFRMWGLEIEFVCSKNYSVVYALDMSQIKIESVIVKFRDYL